MKSLFDTLKQLNPSVEKIYEYKSKISEKEDLWTCIARTSISTAFAGGTDISQVIARAKCLYEGIERSYINEISKNNSDSFFLRKFPSSNGFACGPDKSFAIRKAIFEGLERYCWDQWIDHKLSMVEFHGPVSEVSSYLLKNFRKHLLLSSEIISTAYSDQRLIFKACIGFSDTGVFWGTQFEEFNINNNFEHAIIEAQRNYRTFKSEECANSRRYEDIILHKYGTYGLNGTTLSIDSIQRTHLIPNKFSFLDVDCISDGVWIARCLVDGFVESRSNGRMAFW